MREVDGKHDSGFATGALPPRTGDPGTKEVRSSSGQLPLELFDAYERRVRFLVEALKKAAVAASTLEEEQELLAGRLRDLMASRASLRRTDFDRIMSGLRSSRQRARGEVEEALSGFEAEEAVCQGIIREVFSRAVGEQLACSRLPSTTADAGGGELRPYRLKSKAAGTVRLPADDTDPEVLLEHCRSAFAVRDQRLTELAEKLVAFQRDQEELAASLVALLGRRESVRPRHLRSAVEMLRHRQWIRRQPAFRAVEQFKRISDGLVAEWGGLRGAPCAPEMEGPSECAAGA